MCGQEVCGVVVFEMLINMGEVEIKQPVNIYWVFLYCCPAMNKVYPL